MIIKRGNRVSFENEMNEIPPKDLSRLEPL